MEDFGLLFFGLREPAYPLFVMTGYVLLANLFTSHVLQSSEFGGARRAPTRELFELMYTTRVSTSLFVSPHGHPSATDKLESASSRKFQFSHRSLSPIPVSLKRSPRLTASDAKPTGYLRNRVRLVSRQVFATPPWAHQKKKHPRSIFLFVITT